ncbi:hypothetical protein C9374_001885 [Naegleria lovaniensis]|uniref:Protein kinase domain-containing protein n=1 Tax=Naegleria lovaniensis TaxID=51637 RepID=A0AA88GTY9_NAELO|nr:uncharacterized protein C9374_001885 [Naegleria lovaniensis]KAG2386850.1 hypothetical protein C9374_001885 [Naegleria lovaniensis]
MHRASSHTTKPERIKQEGFFKICNHVSIIIFLLTIILITNYTELVRCGKFSLSSSGIDWWNNYQQTQVTPKSTTDAGSDDIDYSNLFVDSPPQLSLFGVHKIITAKFVNSSLNEFMYLPSKRSSTMSFYFLTVVNQFGFMKIDCLNVFNSLEPSKAITRTIVLGKYNLEEQRVTWAVRKSIDFYFGRPFAYVTNNDEIIIVCNIKNDQGIYSKRFYQIKGDTDEEPSFETLNTSKEVNIVMEGSIDRNGASKWNVKLVYDDKDFFEMHNIMVSSVTQPKQDPLMVAFNFLGTGDLKTFDTASDNFVTQTYYRDGKRQNYKISSVYPAATVVSVTERGVFQEMFTLRTYPNENVTNPMITVRKFFYDSKKQTFILLAFVSGALGFTKTSTMGAVEGFMLYNNASFMGSYVIVSYEKGKTPTCVKTSYFGEDPVITSGYFISKRLLPISNDTALLYLEVFETKTGSLIDSSQIEIKCDNPLDLKFSILYEKRRYLILQNELVFILYLNTHPPSTLYDYTCHQQLVCRERDGDNLCNGHGTCRLDGSCGCDTYYLGTYCETYFFVQLFVIIGVISFLLVVFIGSFSTLLGLYLYKSINHRLTKLKKKEQAEQELEQKLLEYEGLQINERAIDLNTWIIPFDQLTIEREIVNTSGKTILQGNWKGTIVAVKKVQLNESVDYMGESQELLLDKSLEREASIMSRVRHPNILRFWGLCFTKTDQFLVTELFDYSLDSLIEDLRKNTFYLPTQVKIQILHDIACAMTYLHEFQPPILHRNIKPSTIMLCDDIKYGKVLTSIKPKIADFGLSTHLREDNVLTMQIGTVLYSDPLIFKGERYSEKCDVYSFSMLMYELFFETEPYSSSERVGEVKEQYNHYSVLPSKIVEGYRPKVPFSKALDSIGDWMEDNLELVNERIIDPEFLARSIQSFIELMKKCWSGDQDERPSFRVIQDTLSQILKGEIKSSNCNKTVNCILRTY